MVSASVGADFPMIPCESALFSGVCKPTSLGIVPCQVTAKASVPPDTMVCPLRVAPERPLDDIASSKPVDFYALSCGSFRKQARNLIETAQRKSQVITSFSFVSLLLARPRACVASSCHHVLSNVVLTRGTLAKALCQMANQCHDFSTRRLSNR